MIIQNPERPAPDEVIATLAELEVTYIDFDGNEQTGTIVMHRDLVDDVAAFFARTLELRFPINRVCPASTTPFLWDDDKLMAANITSGFNYRTIAHSGKPSLHGLGMAFDVNTVQNPMITLNDANEPIRTDPPEAVWDPKVPGTLYEDHPLVRLMVERGWTWLGSRMTIATDYQHFQKRLETDEV